MRNNIQKFNKAVYIGCDVPIPIYTNVGTDVCSPGRFKIASDLQNRVSQQTLLY